MGEEQSGGIAFLAVLLLCIGGGWAAWRRTSAIAQQRGAGRWARWGACFAVACVAVFGVFCVSGGLLLPDPTNAGHTVATTGAFLLVPLVFMLWRMAKPRTSATGQALAEVATGAPMPMSLDAANDADTLSLPREFRFAYTDQEGQASRRRVRVMGISSNDGRQYLDGFCLDRNAARTFRVDRVQGDLTDAETGELVNVYRLLASTDQRRLMDYTPSKAEVVWSELHEEFDEEPPTTVLFTGFPKARKEALEAAAVAAGWVVRSTVSQSLDYLVTGPKAGPAKVTKANGLFVTVIDEDVFEALICNE